MRKINTFLLLWSVLPAMLHAAQQMTATNVASLSQRHVLVVTSLGCDAGQMHVESVIKALNDLEGVKIVWADGNQSSRIFKDPPQFAFGSVLLVKDSMILDTSSAYQEMTGHANISGNDVRTWVFAALTKHGVSFKMEKPGESFSDPVSDNAPANIDAGLTMHYPLRTDLKDATGQHGDFEIGAKNSTPNGAYYMSGEYGSGKGGHFYDDGYAHFRGLKGRAVFTEAGAGASVNIKPEPAKQRDSFLFSLGERRFSYWISAKTGGLYLVASAYCSNCGPGGKSDSYEDNFYFSDTTMPYGKWHNIVVSVDLANRRVMTLVNGRRLKDAMLSPMFVAINQMTDYSPSLAFRLLHAGWGAPAHGHTRDVVIYNRAINPNEMKSLAQKYGDQSTPAPPPAAGANKAELNKAFLQAVVNGDVAAAKKNLEAGADVNTIYLDWSALELAAYYGRENLVRLLIEKHADVLHEVRPGLNAQELARSKGFNRIVKLLEDASNKPRFFGHRKIGSFVERSLAPEAPVLQ